jgi:beta-glucosidase
VDGLTVSVDVTNTGTQAGKEVVQVYVHDHKSTLVRPPKELKGFIKVELQPGETKTVSLALGFRAFAYYHPGYKQWIAEDGQFDILIGASSQDIRCSQTVTLQSTQLLPSLLNRESTLREWMDDPRGRRVFEPHLQQIMTQVKAVFNGSQGGESRIDMETMNFLMELPLRDIFHFQVVDQIKSPEEFVDGLLARVN